MAGWLGPLIGAAGSILGGALGGSEKQKGRSRSNSHTRNVSVTSTRGRVEDMVRAAEKNGFNPLTFLRAGGLASFTNSATRGESWSNSFSKTRGSSQSSGPLGAGIAQAATIIGGAVSDNAPTNTAAGAAAAWQSPQAAADNINRQLANVQPGAFGTQPRHRASSVKEAKPELPVDGSPVQPSFETPTATNPFAKDTGIKIDPGVPDAEMFETRYGDNVPVSYGSTMYIGWRDFKHNVATSDFGKGVDKWWNGYRGGDITRATLGTLKTNVWDPAAIAVVENPVYSKGTNVPAAEHWTKKPEFVDGGPKW